MSLFGGSSKSGIKKALNVVLAAAEGDYEARITNVDSHPDMRELFIAINRLIDRNDAFLRESAASMGAVSENRYYRRIVETGLVGAYLTSAQKINAATASIEQKLTGFNTIVEEFKSGSFEAVDQIAEAAGALSSASGDANRIAHETSSRSTNVAAAARQTAANVAGVSEASEELNQSIRTVADQARESVEIANRANGLAQETDGRIGQLEAAAGEIVEVVSFIRDIAAQTNLLALNATIEAARAGDAGKGFAVVAQEVKNLANQTGTATDRIAQRITGIQTTTGIAVQAIATIRDSITGIHETVGEMSAAVDEQQEFVSEIASNVEQSATAANEMNTTIAQVSTAADDNLKAVDGLRQATDRLRHQSDDLGKRVRDFLDSIRSEQATTTRQQNNKTIDEASLP